MKHSLTALMVSLALAGCASTGPLAEVGLVAQAFDNLSAASQPLLDELALAERAQGQRVALARARSNEQRASGTTAAARSRCPEIVLLALPESLGISPVQNGFCLEDSPYWSELGDPPATRAFRRALAAVGDYTTLLMVLAENRNVDEALGQLRVMGGNLGMALSTVGEGGVDAALATALEAFRPLLETAAQRANAQELQRLVRQESAKVQALLTALRGAARPMFNTLSSQTRQQMVDLASDSGTLRSGAARIEGYRQSVANFVILLEQYASLLDELLLFYETPGKPTLAALAQRSAHLSAQAEAWRRALAALHASLP